MFLFESTIGFSIIDHLVLPLSGKGNEESVPVTLSFLLTPLNSSYGKSYCWDIVSLITPGFSGVSSLTDLVERVV